MSIERAIACVREAYGPGTHGCGTLACTVRLVEPTSGAIRECGCTCHVVLALADEVEGSAGELGLAQIRFAEGTGQMKARDHGIGGEIGRAQCALAQEVLRRRGETPETWSFTRT